MKPAKRRLLQERLSGIEFRNRQRQALRRSTLRASLDRQQEGRARQYEPSVYVPNRRRA